MEVKFRVKVNVWVRIERTLGISLGLMLSLF